MKKLIFIGLFLVAVSAVNAQASDYVRRIKASARRHGVDPVIALAIARVESGPNLDPRAMRYEEHLHKKLGCSRLEATSLGLFQIIPAYHMKRCGVKRASKLFYPRINIECGVSYIKYCSDSSETFREAMKCYNGSSAYADKVVKVINSAGGRHGNSMGFYIN